MARSEEIVALQRGDSGAPAGEGWESLLLPETAPSVSVCPLNTGSTSRPRKTLVTVHLALSSWLTYFPNVFGKEVN